MPTAAAHRGAAKSVVVAASTTTEDIRRQYYETLPSGSYWWIREIELDPLTLIVADDNDDLWRVPVTVSGAAITFGTPAEVRVEYVPVPADATTSARRAETTAIVFASRAESRKGAAEVNAAELRKSLGLADDATDADVTAKIAELSARPEVAPVGEAPDPSPVPPQPGTPPGPQPAPTPPAPVVPTADADSTMISKAVLDQLQADAALGVAASRRQAKDDEDRFIARNRNRIGPASNPHASRLEASWRREWQRNQGEAEALASTHAVIAPTEARGHDEGAENLDGDDALYASLFGAATSDKGA